MFQMARRRLGNILVLPQITNVLPLENGLHFRDYLGPFFIVIEVSFRLQVLCPNQILRGCLLH